MFEVLITYEIEFLILQTLKLKGLWKKQFKRKQFFLKNYFCFYNILIYIYFEDIKKKEKNRIILLLTLNFLKYVNGYMFWRCFY